MRISALLALLPFSALAIETNSLPPPAVIILPLAEQQPATCKIQQQKLYGNYGAVQSHAYKPECILRTDSSPLAALLAPIGHRSVGPRSRVSLGADQSILLSLDGASDNTLNGGLRGRQEVADCFFSEQDFQQLPAEEQAFRLAASDVYRNCAQASRRYAAYVFDLSLEDSPTAPANTWDAVIMQLHSVDDKDRYCIPRDPSLRNSCDRYSGEVGRSPRNAAAYRALINNGAVFESGVQPPLSFRVKDGYFSIVAASSLQDSRGQLSAYRNQQVCTAVVNSIAVNKVKRCSDSGKTVTVVYRAPLASVLPSNRYQRFRVQVKWPTYNDPSSSLRVERLDANNRVMQVLVNETAVPIGAIDDQFPYFKAGIYRQNRNAVPTHVRIANVRRVHHFQDPSLQSIHQWGERGGHGVIGTVFEYANPFTQATEYFALASLDNDGRYGYFPINKTSNSHWNYLGTARNWGENDRKAPLGSVFVYANPYTGLSEYFQLKAVGADSRYWYFPTDESDNFFWTYLGSR